MTRTTERWTTAGLLALAVLARLGDLNQPIVENYVGRQVPTAMVARNLDRGSGFLRPTLDTEPAPNLFLVEPPIYAAAAVGLRRLSGLDLEPAGRLASALAIGLAGWGLHGLVRRRHGPGAAALAVVAFAAFPVTLRYGRAFQPDALALGLAVAGLRCWDERAAGGRAGWALAGSALLSVALAQKVTAAYILIPLYLAAFRGRRLRSLAWLPALAIPALLWYAHAAALMADGGGSRASADNGAIWLRALVPTTLLDPSFYRMVGRYAVVRWFTPVGLGLACWGCWKAWRGGERLWAAWGLAALAMLGGLAAKAHHEYYGMALAPAAAAGAGVALAGLKAGRRWAATAALVALAAVQARSTFATPPEWAGLPPAAGVVRRLVPEGDRVVAPEALLYMADRRGCRLEVAPGAQRRAAGEWGADLDPADPAALVEFYRARGAGYFADLAPAGLADPRRDALHRAIRRRHEVLVDRDGLLLARLRPGDDSHAAR